MLAARLLPVGGIAFAAAVLAASMAVVARTDHGSCLPPRRLDWAKSYWGGGRATELLPGISGPPSGTEHKAVVLHGTDLAAS